MADENEKKVYYWIVIDDDKAVLRNINTELRNEGETNIFSLKPSGRKKIESPWTNKLSFKIPLPAADEAIVLPDYDYKVIPYNFTPDDGSSIEGEETTLYELLKTVPCETAQEKQPYFIFLIDLLFEGYNFCGFDLFKFVRCTIVPKRYVVKFLSHLSRKMVSEFLRAEFPDLKLGQEASKSTGKRFVGDVADDGFFSKAPYRTTGMAILSKHRIVYLKAIFPRSMTENEGFALNVIYPYEHDFGNSESKIDLSEKTKTKTVFSSSFYVRKKTKKTYKKRAFYDNRQTILKNAIINSSCNSYEEMIKGIYNNRDYDKETPKYSKFTKKQNIIFSENDYWSPECSSLREPFPLYRHELKRWYYWTNPAYEIVDAFYIYNTQPKPEVTVKCNGAALKVKMILTPTDLLKEVELHRPRYILIELPQDDNFNTIYSICNITECISYFEIHGFAVIFVAGDVEDNKLSGIREIAPNILIAKNDTIEFEEMSPIYWHLIEKSYFQGGTFIEHELSHLSSCPLGNREEKLKKIIRLAEAHDALAHTHYTPKIEALLAGEGGKIDKEDDKWYIMENNTSKEIDINAYLYEKKYKVSLEIICTTPNDTEEEGVKKSLNAKLKEVVERSDSQFVLADDGKTAEDGNIILFVCNSMKELTTINANVKKYKVERKSKGKAVVFYVLHRYGNDFLSSKKPNDNRDGSVQNLRDNIGSDHWLLTYEVSIKNKVTSYNMELDSCYFILQGLLKKIEKAKIEEAEKIKEIPNITIANWIKTRDVDINK